MCIPSIIFHCWATAALLLVFQPKRGHDHMALPFGEVIGFSAACLANVCDSKAPCPLLPSGFQGFCSRHHSW